MYNNFYCSSKLSVYVCTEHAVIAPHMIMMILRDFTWSNEGILFLSIFRSSFCFYFGGNTQKAINYRICNSNVLQNEIAGMHADSR